MSVLYGEQLKKNTRGHENGCAVVASRTAQRAKGRKAQSLFATPSPCVGFGRIVASEKEAPNMLANLIGYEEDEWRYKATMRPRRPAPWSACRARSHRGFLLLLIRFIPVYPTY